MNNKVNCKGSITLGNACMKCSKCLEQIKEMKYQKEKEKRHFEHDHPSIQYAPIGWTCPRCGSGLSPNTMRCPCVQLPIPEIT